MKQNKKSFKALKAWILCFDRFGFVDLVFQRTETCRGITKSLAFEWFFIRFYFSGRLNFHFINEIFLNISRRSHSVCDVYSNRMQLNEFNFQKHKNIKLSQWPSYLCISLNFSSIQYQMTQMDNEKKSYFDARWISTSIFQMRKRFSCYINNLSIRSRKLICNLFVACNLH